MDAKDDDLIEVNAGGKIISAKRCTLTQLKGTRFEGEYIYVVNIKISCACNVMLCICLHLYPNILLPRIYTKNTQSFHIYSALFSGRWDKKLQRDGNGSYIPGCKPKMLPGHCGLSQ